MDPLSAISLAGNVLGFLDFTSQFIASVREIHASTQGSTQRDRTVKQVTRDLKQFATNLRSCQTPVSTLDPRLSSLIDLCSDCEDLAEDLLNLLSQVQAEDHTSRRQSAKAALRRLWKSKDIEEAQRRLDLLSQALDRRTAEAFREETRHKLNQIIQTGNAQQVDIAELQRHVDSIRDSISVASFDCTALKQLQDFVKLSDECVYKVRQALVLEELKFDDMDDRFDQVDSAHSGTFEWIFVSQDSATKTRNPWIRASRRFNHWLAKGATIFHVLGKPGCGKSTFMKFLCKHARVRQELELWAGNKQLVVANFFFWRAGSRMQGSLEGLIRSLLHAVLKELPHLIPIVLPNHWATTKATAPAAVSSSRLEREDIINAFEMLISSSEVFDTHRFAFFIDGLDEFEPDGHRMSYVDLACLLKQWCSNRQTSIKICLSSREYPVFKTEFMNYPRLRMQDITTIDMHKLARDYLQKSKYVSQLGLSKVQLQEIQNRLVLGSRGIFLWLTLVIRNIDEGIINGDDFNDVLTRISSVPAELSELFAHILKTIPASDRSYCLSILRLMHETGSCSYSMCVLDFWCIDMTLRKESLDGLVQKLSPENATSSQIKNRFHQELNMLSNRIMGRFRGLLDYPKVTGKKSLKKSVLFSHRSIHDFLSTEDAMRSLGDVFTDYDWYSDLVDAFVLVASLMMHPRLNFIATYLTKSEYRTSKDFSSHASEFWANRVIQLSRFTRQRLNSLPPKFYLGIEDFNTALARNPILSAYWDPKSCPNATHIVIGPDRWFTSLKCDCNNVLHFSNDQAMVWGGVHEYFGQKKSPTQDGTTIAATVDPVLAFITVLDHWRFIDTRIDSNKSYSSPSDETLRVFLEAGLDPNASIIISRFKSGPGFDEIRLPLLAVTMLFMLSHISSGKSRLDLVPLFRSLDMLVQQGLDTRLWFITVPSKDGANDLETSSSGTTKIYPRAIEKSVDGTLWSFIPGSKVFDPNLLDAMPSHTTGCWNYRTLGDVLQESLVELSPQTRQSLGTSRDEIIRDIAQFGQSYEDVIRGDNFYVVYPKSHGHLC